MKRMTLALAVALGSALLAGCAHAPQAAATPSIPLLQPLPGLYTAGQPAASDWRAIKADGIRTVINLRAPGELQGRDEAAEVRAAGLRYIDIPVAHADGINADNARLLHAALSPKHGGGVLVHCASGNRAGALLALEQKDFDGMTPEAALALGKQAGVTKLEGTLKQALGIQ
ncbi:MAG: hypothetical protein KGL91_07305 [Xanthomonadaceae bacterium]|nr:hypothetical protein [Xanthomonadaceae bacterium]